MYPGVLSVPSFPAGLPPPPPPLDIRPLHHPRGGHAGDPFFLAGAVAALQRPPGGRVHHGRRCPGGRVLGGSYKAKSSGLELAFLELMVSLQSEVLVSYMYVQLCSPRANCMCIVFLHPV